MTWSHFHFNKSLALVECWLSKRPPKSVNQATLSLLELGAVKENTTLTVLLMFPNALYSMLRPVLSDFNVHLSRGNGSGFGDLDGWPLWMEDLETSLDEAVSLDNWLLSLAGLVFSSEASISWRTS